MKPIDLKPGACLIGGEWVTGEAVITVTNPADGSIQGAVPLLGANSAQAAVDAAEKALPGWAALAAGERAAFLGRYHGLIVDHTDALAAILTAEQGKPLAEAKDEVLYASRFIRWFGEEAQRAYGDVIPGHASDKRIVVLKQPIGVVAAITPWNFPAAMITRKIGPALAAGCTVVLKPAEQTPMTALALGALAVAAGIPPGVLNIITGDPREIGEVWTRSNVVRKLSFTGSTEVGALLYAQCASTIKKLSLELGGNAPFIVFDDADLELAVEGAIQAKFRNAGQTCVSANRFYIQAGIHDRFVLALAKAADALVVGPGDDPKSQVGPLIDDEAVSKVEMHFGDALSLGGRLETLKKRCCPSRRYFPPTVLSGAHPEMLGMRQEIFGPLAMVTRFDTEAQVIELANESPLGLAAYIYTRDNNRVWRVAESIEAGMVGINTGLISSEAAPFGGVKASGLGREGSYYGLDDYLETKMLCVGL